MTTDSRSSRIEVQVPGDLERAELLIRNLRRELEDIGLETIGIPSVDRKPGARGGGGDLPAVFLLKLVPQLVGKTATAITNWFRRSGERSVELTIGGDSIKLSRATPDQQDRLVALLEAKAGGLPALRGPGNADVVPPASSPPELPSGES
jgi:hypothetical protein